MSGEHVAVTLDEALREAVADAIGRQSSCTPYCQGPCSQECEPTGGTVDEEPGVGAVEVVGSGNAAGFPLVQGECPACGSRSLFLGAGGYVTCSRLDCREPDAPTSALVRPATPDPTPEVDGAKAGSRHSGGLPASTSLPPAGAAGPIVAPEVDEEPGVDPAFDAARAVLSDYSVLYYSEREPGLLYGLVTAVRAATPDPTPRPADRCETPREMCRLGERDCRCCEDCTHTSPTRGDDR